MVQSCEIINFDEHKRKKLRIITFYGPLMLSVLYLLHYILPFSVPKYFQFLLFIIHFEYVYSSIQTLK